MASSRSPEATACDGGRYFAFPISDRWFPDGVTTREFESQRQKSRLRICKARMVRSSPLTRVIRECRPNLSDQVLEVCLDNKRIGPDGRRVVYPQLDAVASDIMVVDDFH